MATGYKIDAMINTMANGSITIPMNSSITLTINKKPIQKIIGVFSGLLANMILNAMNKQIVERLGIALRTVEVHRARVLEKMGGAIW